MATPGDDTDQGSERKVLGELQSRTREREPAGLHNADERQGQYRARNIVESRLGDDCLGYFGAEFQAVEQGDEDGGVCGGQDRSDEQGHRERDAEHGGDPKRDDEGCQEYARQDEQAEAYGGTRDHTQRDAGAAVEQDEGHTYVEQELGAHPAERIGDEPEHEGPIRAPAATSTTIWGSLMTVAMSCESSPAPSMRPKLRRMCSISSTLADQGYELLRERPPTQVLHAILAHDFLAPPPLLLRQLQVVA
jgi:hypothetical protein